MEFKLEIWLAGYKRSCTSEFFQLVNRTKKQITLIKNKRQQKEV